MFFLVLVKLYKSFANIWLPHEEKSLCSDYTENVGQNRMGGIRSYNRVCKFLYKTHTFRRQQEAAVQLFWSWSANEYTVVLLQYDHIR